MSSKPAIYDTEKSKSISLEALKKIYRHYGVTRVIYKPLAPNDNSKNQLYFAGHFTDIGFIPTREIVASPSTSLKNCDPKRQVKFTAGLDFNWISSVGVAYNAPTAKLIYYPQFPEVRLSGFLKGCSIDMGGWMDPSKKGRFEGRVLFLGLRDDGAIFAFLATPGSRIAEEVKDSDFVALSNVLRELPFGLEDTTQNCAMYAVRERMAKYQIEFEFSRLKTPSDKSRYLLLSELKRINLASPIESKKLGSNGIAKSYRAKNGGGYTLEAELGVAPNGIAEPDFQGWEIKQFGVKKFHLTGSKALTIMTPEPDGGLYKDQGVKSFMDCYGYDNAKIADRRDFTGRHFHEQYCDKSSLTLKMLGFDVQSSKMVDATGCIGLLDEKDNLAASWSYAKLLEHWKKKHAKAAYIPSVASDTVEGTRAYHYGDIVRLYEGTNIDLLLGAVAEHKVYYDPGIKMEQVSTVQKVKKRSQFRIKSKDLNSLYDQLETVDLNKPF